MSKKRTYQCDDALYAQLGRMAQEHECSASAVVRAAIARFQRMPAKQREAFIRQYLELDGVRVWTPGKGATS